jgi:GTPase SAR1 family protein
MTDNANKTIRRKSLGRAALIGSLYNATRDTFCGTTILKAKIPSDSISRIEIPNNELSYEYEDSYKEKFKKLDVEAELKLSILARMFNLEGSGKYLNDVKDSSRTVKGNLIHRITSVEESLNIYRDDVKACISTDGFSNSDATHIVIGIKWGAIMIASFKCKDAKEEDKSQVEAVLKSHFEKFELSISGNDNVNIEKNDSDLMKRFSIELLGDAIPHKKKSFRSFDEARKVITELPLYTKKSNNGKGFPIEYILYPLSELAKELSQNVKVNSLIMETSEEIILKIEQIFDDLFKSKETLNDLFNDAKSISNLISDKIFDEINNHVHEVKLEDTKFRKELAENLVKIRSGKNNIDELDNIIKTFQDGVLSKNSIMNFINKYQSISAKAIFVLTLKEKKVEFLDKNSTIDHILRKNSKGHVYILIDEDISCDNSSLVHSEFQALYNSNERSSKFFVADPKINPAIKGLGYPVIHHYVDGKLVEPPEEINILLLGETGVGKSTFINAFANYLKFKTLNKAKSGNMEVLISSKFTVTDDKFETKTIKIGDDDSNEQLENVGMSSTQECKSYVFQAAAGSKLIRLIDTPGIGDTRGLDQDKKNFENILHYIGHHQYINGICILLKPNNARLTVVFRFCIQELLSHLHRNAKDNIVFCFTNARGTFYRPGDTLPPLKKQLCDLKERSSVEIKVNQDTIYCFDNESFRFLAAIKKGIKFAGTDEQNFAESWKKSVDESLRLIKYLATRPPHAVKDTLSLNSSRNIVVLLSKPLAEIGQLIQTNIKLIKEQQNEIKNSNQTIEELKDKLYITQIDLEPVTLGYPRTVCTSSGCVESLQIEQTNIKKIDYITHCHPHCYLDGVTCNQVNNPALRGCKAMNQDGKCEICGCKWDKHMHITYENDQVTKNIKDQNVELQISKKKSDQETKRAIIEEYQARVDQLQIEQHTINEISLKFAQFLRQNAIAAFNDAYADYLDHFINEEKIKKSADPSRYDDEILKGLEATKRSYLEQIEVIRKAIETNDPSMPTISPNDIANLEQQLYNLPINGHTLKKVKDEAKRSQTSVFRYKESYYSRPINFISDTFAKIFR